MLTNIAVSLCYFRKAEMFWACGGTVKEDCKFSINFDKGVRERIGDAVFAPMQYDKINK